MIRRQSLLTMSLVLCLAGMARADGIEWFDGTFEEALKEARRRDTIVMIDFYTEWSIWCDVLDEQTYSDDEVAGALAELVCKRINPEEENEALARKYEVRSYPTSVFVDGKGALIDRIDGLVGPKQFLGMLKRIRKGEGTLAAILEALARDDADPEAHYRMAERLLARGEKDKAKAHLEKVIAGDALNEEGYTDDAQFRLITMELGDGLSALAELKRRLARRMAVFDEITVDLRLDEAMDKAVREAIERALAATNQILATAHEEAEEAVQEAREVLAGSRATVYGRAAARIEDFLARYPDTQAKEEAYRWLKNIYRESGNQEKATEMEEKLALLSADDPETLNKLAWSMYKRGADLARAKEFAERAVELAPEAAHIIDTLAEIEFALGNPARAIELIKRAIELEPQESLYEERLTKYEAGT